VDRLVAPLASVMAYRSDLQDELLDVRRMFEPAVARVAALRAKDEDLAIFNASLTRNGRNSKPDNRPSSEDTAFSRHPGVRIVADMQAANDLLVDAHASLAESASSRGSVDDRGVVADGLARDEALRKRCSLQIDLQMHDTHRGPPGWRETPCLDDGRLSGF